MRLVALDNLFVLNKHEQSLVCKRKIEIIMFEHPGQMVMASVPMNTLADFELSKYHNCLHEVFERLLQAITHGIVEYNKVCFVMHSL